MLIEILLALAKGKLPNAAHRKEMRNVVGGHTAAAVGVVVVLQRRRRSIFRRKPSTAAGIDRLGPRVRDEILETVRKAMIQFDLQRVVIGVAAIGSEKRSTRDPRERLSLGDLGRSSSSGRRCSVEQTGFIQTVAIAADVPNRECKVPGHLPLDFDVPLLRSGILAIGIEKPIGLRPRRWPG